jgi:UDP-N-acetylglucosamine--N-acetylmuramyl-(pentapeptide) pyrophosphoryl-undecaprenol N-acetylglucosamine transferase
VLALGGWPCVPAALAARSKKIPLCLLASDARPGLAVRKLAPLAARVYVARDSAAASLGGGTRVCLTGPALRRQVVDAEADPARFGLADGVPTLFVTGGSLGAKALNERMAAGIRRAVEADPSLASRLQVLHSVGHSGAGVEEAYRAAGVRHRVLPFVREMGIAYRTADLVVARAGALTCAELQAAGTPAVLVPYPHHADRQQYVNAEALARTGAAHVIEEEALDPPRVRRDVLELLADPERRRAMADAMRAGFSDGARQIAVDLVRLLKGTAGVSPASAAT